MNRCTGLKSEAPRWVPAPPRPSLPRDLREAVEPVTLMAWVQEAVLDLNWGHPLVCDYLRQRPEDRPQIMLTLLAFVFLTRTCSSDAIAFACRVERDLNLLCEGTPPFASEITAFRRKNRRLLQFVMGLVIARVLQEKDSARSGSPVPGATDEAQRQATNRLDLAHHMDSE